MHQGSIKDGKLILQYRTLPKDPVEGHPYSEAELVDGKKSEISLKLLHEFATAAEQGRSHGLINTYLNRSEGEYYSPIMIMGIGLDDIFKDAAEFKKIDTLSYGIPMEVVFDESVVSADEYAHNLMTQALNGGTLDKEHGYIKVDYVGDLPESKHGRRDSYVDLCQAYINAAHIDRIEDKGAYRSVHLKPVCASDKGSKFHTALTKDKLEKVFDLK